MESHFSGTPGYILIYIPLCTYVHTYYPMSLTLPFFYLRVCRMDVKKVVLTTLQGIPLSSGFFYNCLMCEFIPEVKVECKNPAEKSVSSAVGCLRWR